MDAWLDFGCKSVPFGEYASHYLELFDEAILRILPSQSPSFFVSYFSP